MSEYDRHPLPPEVLANAEYDPTPEPKSVRAAHVMQSLCDEVERLPAVRLEWRHLDGLYIEGDPDDAEDIVAVESFAARWAAAEFQALVVRFNAAPALVAEVRRLTAEMERLRENHTSLSTRLSLESEQALRSERDAARAEVTAQAIRRHERYETVSRQGRDTPEAGARTIHADRSTLIAEVRRLTEERATDLRRLAGLLGISSDLSREEIEGTTAELRRERDAAQAEARRTCGGRCPEAEGLRTLLENSRVVAARALEHQEHMRQERNAAQAEVTALRERLAALETLVRDLEEADCVDPYSAPAEYRFRLSTYAQRARALRTAAQDLSPFLPNDSADPTDDRETNVTTTSST